MEDFPLAPDLIYLNHAGVGVWPEATAEAVERFARENAFQGAAAYKIWLTVEQRLRERLARMLHATTQDIALIKNTSEGLSMIAYGLNWQAGDEIIINDLEFPSNRIVWESLAERYGVRIRDVALTGSADPEAALIEAMNGNTRLLAVSSVQYGTGLRMDLGRLGQACRERDVLFCVDAIQSLGATDLDVDAVHADFVVADGHKWMLGPEGIGVFYSRESAREQLSLLQYGWRMVKDAGNYDSKAWASETSAKRFECGSPNMVGIHGLEASLAVLEQIGYGEIENSIRALTDELVERIEQEPALALQSPTDPAKRLGIINFRVIDKDAADIHRHLMDNRVICAHRAGGIRFAPHVHNTPAQVHQALDMALAAGKH